MVFDSYIIIDPDEISCYLVKYAILAIKPGATISVFANATQAIANLEYKNVPSCVIIDYRALELKRKDILILLKELSDLNYQVIILSNAFHVKIAYILKKFPNVRFCFKPITREMFLK